MAEKNEMKSGPVDRDGRPKIVKLGTIDYDMVEATPIAFKGEVWRGEWVRKGFHPERAIEPNYFRFVRRATGEILPPVGPGTLFGSAFADGDTAYVAGTVEGGQNRVRVFRSEDLLRWEELAGVDLARYHVFNTSICKADGRYVMMFEIDEPPEEAGKAFTARFAVSDDMERWEITPPECCYEKSRYTAPHCLRWLEGWYYDFYLEAWDNVNGWETRVVRSRDLVHWESSPLNPVLSASDAEDKKIANPAIPTEQRERIRRIKNVNNSDIDFCEHQGRLVISYSWGTQQGDEFLAEATYEGSQEQFLRGWFN
jgi:alpha-L-fucosidase